jgi:hypothetical protein
MLVKLATITIHEIVECINEKDLIQEYLNDANKLTLYNRAYTWYPALYYSTLYKPTPLKISKIRTLTGIEIKNVTDLEMFKSEILRLRSKLKEMLPVDFKTNTKLSLERIVAATESILGIQVDRSIKMYQFKHIYQSAQDKAREYDKISKKYA